MVSDNDYTDLFEDFPELKDPDIMLEKEVLAHFGLLFSAFANLEAGLQNCYLFWQLEVSVLDGNATPENWAPLNDELNQKARAATFGSLLRLVSGCEELGSSMERLNSLKKTRDYFAHHFFREENDKMFSDESQMRLISKMNEVRRSVRVEDARVDKIGMALFQKLHPKKDLNAGLKEEAIRAKEAILSDPSTSFGWETK